MAHILISYSRTDRVDELAERRPPLKTLRVTAATALIGILLVLLINGGNWNDGQAMAQLQTEPATFTPSFIIAGSVNQQVWPEVVSQTFDGVEMVYVPGGCFMMGSNDGEGNERPAHQVCLDGFWIDRAEVTNEQYGSVGCPDYSSEPDEPRNCVNWIDAEAFCESRGARLPTEAEWEYAARGPEGLIYPWSNTFVADNVIYSGNSSKTADVGNKPDILWVGAWDMSGNSSKTADVGSKPDGASWVGAWDMSGNLWEWVADWYDAGTYATLTDGTKNPTGPTAGEYRVLRGGSFSNGDINVLRAAYRLWFTPYSENLLNGGFRCARSDAP